MIVNVELRPAEAVAALVLVRPPPSELLLMRPMTMSLLESLAEIVSLFESHGETHWSQWIRSDAADLLRGDLAGARHFLSAFGGMGSLNDRYLCVENGDRISKSEVRAVNARLAKTLSHAWSLADELVRCGDSEDAA
jgi:hypothetical protein